MTVFIIFYVSRFALIISPLSPLFFENFSYWLNLFIFTLKDPFNRKFGGKNPSEQKTDCYWKQQRIVPLTWRKWPQVVSPDHLTQPTWFLATYVPSLFFSLNLSVCFTLKNKAIQYDRGKTILYSFDSSVCIGLYINSCVYSSWTL